MLGIDTSKTDNPELSIISGLLSKQNSTLHYRCTALMEKQGKQHRASIRQQEASARSALLPHAPLLCQKVLKWGKEGGLGEREGGQGMGNTDAS